MSFFHMLSIAYVQVFLKSSQCIIMLLSFPVSCFRQSVDTQKFAAHFTLYKPRRLSSRRQQKSASERKGSDGSGVLRFIIFDNAIQCLVFCSLIWVRPGTTFRKGMPSQFFPQTSILTTSPGNHHKPSIFRNRCGRTRSPSEYMLNRWQTTVRAYVVVSEFALLAGCKVYSEIPKNNTIKI